MNTAFFRNLFLLVRLLKLKQNKKMHFSLSTIFLFFSLSLLVNCGGTDVARPNASLSKQELAEPLINANIKVVRNESAQIDSYIERHHLNMIQTGTGLRYVIYQKGSGIKAEQGKLATIKFKIFLMDGTLVYSSDKKGAEEFLIGQDQKESGLHEGIQFMHVGDKAKMILPPHLAHGLLGDENKIPSRAVILYDVELISLR